MMRFNAKRQAILAKRNDIYLDEIADLRRQVKSLSEQVKNLQARLNNVHTEEKAG